MHRFKVQGFSNLWIIIVAQYFFHFPGDAFHVRDRSQTHVPPSRWLPDERWCRHLLEGFNSVLCQQR